MNYSYLAGLFICFLILMSGAWAKTIPLVDDFEDNNYLTNPKWINFYGNYNSYTSSTDAEMAGTIGLKVTSPSTGYLNTTIINPTKDINYGAWIYRSDSPSQFIILFDDTNSGNTGIVFDFYTNVLRKGICTDGTNVGAPALTRSWHYIAINIDGNLMKSWVYTDQGSLLYSSTDIVSCATGRLPTSIALINTENTAFFDNITYGSTTTNDLNWDSPNIAHSGGGTGKTMMGQYIPQKDGLITSLKAYVNGSQTQHFRIWADNGSDANGAILGTSNTTTCGTGDCEYLFSTPVQLMAGKKYWVGCQGIGSGDCGVNDEGSFTGKTQQKAIFRVDTTNYAGTYIDLNLYEDSTINANFTSTIDKTNAKIILKDTSTSGNTINDWNWFVDTVYKTNTQDYNFSPITELTDYNVCLRAKDTSLAIAQTCTNISSDDWTPPTTTLTTSQIANTTKQNLSFTCTDNNSGCKWLTFKVDGNAWGIVNNTGTIDFNWFGLGTFDVNWWSTDNLDNNESMKHTTFTNTGELIPPTITLTTTQGFGFVTDYNIGVTITCQDNWLDPITYDINLFTDANNYNLYHIVDVNNQTKTYYFINSLPQQVRFKGRCTDGSGNYAEIDSETIYQLLFRLINEQTGANITTSDLNSWLSTALVYSYDGNFSFDFNGSGVTQKKFLSPGQEIRFDFAYKGSTVTIGRDIDFSLTSDTNIPICLAPPQTFYIQTFYSASTKPTILYSDSTHCYNMISNTKFALENGLMSRAYTIPKPYLLKTIIGGITTTLTSIDGSLENTINLDSLQFNQSALDIKIGSDAISFGKDLSDYNIMKFYYVNPNDDSTSTTFVIKNGSTIIFTQTENGTPNEFVANWNYVDANLDSNTILNMTVNKTIGGVVESYTFYFTIEATYYQGSVNEWFALIVAFCLVLFGMTLVVYKFSFGWFGLIMLGMAFLILSLAPSYWHINFFKGIILILIIFVGIVFKNETQGAV